MSDAPPPAAPTLPPPCEGIPRRDYEDERVRREHCGHLALYEAAEQKARLANSLATLRGQALKELERRYAVILEGLNLAVQWELAPAIKTAITKWCEKARTLFAEPPQPTSDQSPPRHPKGT